MLIVISIKQSVNDEKLIKILLGARLVRIQVLSRVSNSIDCESERVNIFNDSQELGQISNG